VTKGTQVEEIEIKANIRVEVKKEWLRIQVVHRENRLFDKIEKRNNVRLKGKQTYDNSCKTWLSRHNRLHKRVILKQL